MSTLLVQTLETELSQVYEFTMDKRQEIVAIIPYLYVHNAPAGTFTLSLITNSETVFSQTFTSQDVLDSLETTDDYARVFFPIVPLVHIQLERGEFTIKLSSTGYTNTSSSFLGWIQQHEDLNNELSYTPSGDDQNPLALRLKIYKEGIL